MARGPSSTSDPQLHDDTELCSLRFRALGTEIEIGVVCTEQTRDRIAEDLEELRLHCLHYERILSRFRADSDLSRVNDNPGSWVAVDATLAEVLRLALRASQESDGLFHPAVGGALVRLGYDVSFELIDRSALSNDRRDALLAACPIQGVPYEIRCSGQAHWVKLRHGHRLDLGGIAKGWIVEQGALWLRRRGYHQFVYNAGGDLVCSGRFGSRPWRIAIADPFRSAHPRLVLEVDSLAVATSGTYKRRWETAGSVVHHIIDPRTGRPAQTDLVSCTVVASKLVAAEWMAKGALILGSHSAVRWLATKPLRGWVMVRQDGEVLDAWNSCMNAQLHRSM